MKTYQDKNEDIIDLGVEQNISREKEIIALSRSLLMF